MMKKLLPQTVDNCRICPFCTIGAGGDFRVRCKIRDRVVDQSFWAQAHAYIQIPEWCPLEGVQESKLHNFGVITKDEERPSIRCNHNLLVAFCCVDHEKRVVEIIFENALRYLYSFDFFTPTPNCSPDFHRAGIIDCGQTVQFGTYEVASDALYNDGKENP
jgi:hypothetical protein